jgi:hypothetical protein
VALSPWAIVGRLLTQTWVAIGWTLARIWLKLPGVAALADFIGVVLDAGGVSGFGEFWGAGCSDMTNPGNQFLGEQLQ